MFADTGCKYTLIPPKLYKIEMGELILAKRTLRARGATENLNAKGIIRTTVTTSRGATSRSWVFCGSGAET